MKTAGKKVSGGVRSKRVPVSVATAVHGELKELSEESGIRMQVLADEALAIGLPLVAQRRGISQRVDALKN
jgi:hypothetical protein